MHGDPMLLTGTFSRSLDDKLRLAIPKRLRDALGCPQGGDLYVAPGTDGSLSIYTEGSFEQLAVRLGKSSPTGQQVRSFTRLFYAQAQRLEIDVQGRIRIPQELVSLAKLEKEVVLVGVQDHMELWSATRWSGYLAEKRPHFDEIAEAAFAPP
jgi:MraZ protein